ncbi:hypothetical protein [Streptomyces sp. PTY087I2]|uniref:hypothetical protein n=1 Tax=Streptomyces sp. PTY087I2 TaxID=1819298 RepID=UPI00159EDFBF|nr:hypothetical protein [Streptomyces sp. PTY087I2]
MTADSPLTPRDAVTGEAWEIGTEGDGSTAGFGGGPGDGARPDGSTAGFDGGAGQR